MNSHVIQQLKELYSSYATPDKFIEVFCAVYETNIAAVSVGSRINSSSRVELNKAAFLFNI